LVPVGALEAATTQVRENVPAPREDLAYFLMGSQGMKITKDIILTSQLVAAKDVRRVWGLAIAALKLSRTEGRKTVARQNGGTKEVALRAACSIPTLRKPGIHGLKQQGIVMALPVVSRQEWQGGTTQPQLLCQPSKYLSTKSAHKSTIRRKKLSEWKRIKGVESWGEGGLFGSEWMEEWLIDWPGTHCVTFAIRPRLSQIDSNMEKTVV